MSVATVTELNVTGPIPDAITLSTFAKPARYMTTPSQRKMSWVQLAMLLATHERTTDKDGQGWSPLLYKPGTTRANVNVSGQTCAVSDLDHKTVEDYQTIRAHLDALGLTYCIYSTYQSTPEELRFRVVVPFTREVKSYETNDIWHRVNEHIFLGQNDPNTKDASRMFYRPACPPDALPFAEHHDGLALDPDKLPATTQATDPRPAGEVDKGAVSHLGYETLRFFTFGAAVNYQRGAALAATRACLASGMSVEETAELIWKGLQASPCGDPEHPWTYEDALGFAEDLDKRKPTPLPPRPSAEPLQPDKTVPLRSAPPIGGNGKVDPTPPSSNGHHAPDAKERPPSFPTTDLGNAERLVHRFRGNLRYSHKAGKWLVWNGTRWCFDDSGRVMACAKRTARLIAAEAAEAATDDEYKALLKHARTSEGKERIKAMVELAQSEAGIPVDLNELDADPMLLTVENGTIDLRTGQLREHRREDLITKLAPVHFDPQAKCPTWNKFLSTIMAGADGVPRRRLITFLRRMVGYTLTGLTIEQALFLLYGTGSNGKSTFLEICRAMLGDYAMQTDFGTFLHRDNDRINNDLARLMGTRFVSAVEVESGKRLSESLVKQVTGGDAVTARFLFREFFEFTPSFKILLAANHRPIIRGGDHAMWRRLRLVPFTVTIADKNQDKRLPAKLKAELPGILAWAVKGCLIWQRKGLGVPDEVKEATSEYRDEMDILGGFIAECCVLDRQAYVSASALYKAYTSWCDQQQDEPVKQQTFGTRLTERGIDRRRSSTTGRKEYIGIRLLTDPERAERAEPISSNPPPNTAHDETCPESGSGSFSRSGSTGATDPAECETCGGQPDGGCDGLCQACRTKEFLEEQERKAAAADTSRFGPDQAYETKSLILTHMRIAGWIQLTIGPVTAGPGEERWRAFLANVPPSINLSDLLHTAMDAATLAEATPL